MQNGVKNPMKTVGIIAEYNPFHNGHLYQLKKAKEMTGASCAAVVMSGDYTQRGTPAVFNKYMRTRSALLSGADLVVELPVFGAVASAADFADSGVSLLTAMGAVDFLCFGSECGSLETLKRQAKLFHGEEDGNMSALIKEGLKKGLSWPQAKSLAAAAPAQSTLEQSTPKQSTPDRSNPAESGPAVSPNDILGVEYLRALKKYRSPMEPSTVKRTDDGYHSLTLSGTFASASAIRKAIAENNPGFLDMALPVSFFDSLQMEPCPAIQFDDFSVILGEKLLNASFDELAEISGMPKDLAGKLYRNKLDFHRASGLVAASKDRQYTYARVNRCLMNTILGITKEDTAQFKSLSSAPWIRILGFRRDSAFLLSEIKKQADIPLISKTADYASLLSGPARLLFEKHLRTAELYRLISQIKTGQSMRNEFTRSVVIV